VHDRAAGVGGDVEVCSPESADAAECLSVEQDEQAGDAVGGGQGVVVQEPSGVLPSLVGRLYRAELPGGCRGGRQSSCQVVLPLRPGEEHGQQPMGSYAGGQPVVEVGLGAAGQVEVVLAKGVQEARGLGENLAGAVGGVQCGRALLGAGA